ncbi:hypothetical protein IFM89_021729 [Coptis chinensis]|uniref:Uncharacterized protein n=1 Tax=Coptis chinensis TaxID=261450 RepID=A0A835HNW9_9MAGN|nr:hypothetical protein IFM89_021729 [Coptis chinensis]
MSSMLGAFNHGYDISVCTNDTFKESNGCQQEKLTNHAEFGHTPTPGLMALFSSQVFLKDTDERACAYIAEPAPNRCGFTTNGLDLFDSVNSSLRGNDEPLNSSDLLKNDLQINLSGHPLFFGITLGLLAEIINSR